MVSQSLILFARRVTFCLLFPLCVCVFSCVFGGFFVFFCMCVVFFLGGRKVGFKMGLCFAYELTTRFELIHPTSYHSKVAAVRT